MLAKAIQTFIAASLLLSTGLVAVAEAGVLQPPLTKIDLVDLHGASISSLNLHADLQDAFAVGMTYPIDLLDAEHGLAHLDLTMPSGVRVVTLKTYDLATKAELKRRWKCTTTQTTSRSCTLPVSVKAGASPLSPTTDPIRRGYFVVVSVENHLDVGSLRDASITATGSLPGTEAASSMVPVTVVENQLPNLVIAHAPFQAIGLNETGVVSFASRIKDH
ncbi:MAG: hypothetical protein WCK25_00795 [Actinomycetes bacterium]